MLQKILVAIDDSKHARKVVDAATELGKALNGEVVLLHLRERELSRVGAFDLESTDEAGDLVDGFVREMKDAGVNARSDVRVTLHGRVANDILTESKELGADLIVMGSRGLSDLSALLLGSVAHRVLHLAECPVMIVR